MTEALSQNLENNLDIAFDMLNISNISALEVQEGDNEFSNLINTLSANIEQAQSNFVELAAEPANLKTNISSINKLALETEPQITLQEENIELEEENILQAQVEIKAEENIENIEIEPIEKKAEIKTEEKTEQKPELNSINSSIKEPSSVSLSNETENSTDFNKKEEKNENEELKTAINNALLTFDIDLSENKNLKENIEQKLSEVENIEQLDKTLDNILNFLDNSNLSEGEKDKIKTAFEKIKNLVKQAQDKINSASEDDLKEAKNLLDGIILKISSKNEISNQNVDLSNSVLELDELKAIFKQSQMLPDASGQLEEAISQAMQMLKDFSDALLSGNEIALENMPEALEEAVSTLENALSGKEENEDLLAIDKKLIEALKALKTSLDNGLEEGNLAKNELIQDISNTQDLFNEFSKKIDVDLKQNLEKISSGKNLQDIVKTLDKMQETSVLTSDEKAQIKELISKLAQKNLTQQDAAQKGENQNSLEFVTKEIDKISNSSLEARDNSINKEKTAQQKTKTAFEIFKQEAVENIKYSKTSKIPEISGALSATDEIAKMALNKETNAPINPVNALFETNVGQNFQNGNIFKADFSNLNNNSEIPQFDLEKSDILNQITDKFSKLELKEGQTHKMTLVLRPNDLGRLSIELKSDANGLTTNIIAQNEQVRSFIEKNIHNLKQSLSESGVQVNNIQIKTAGETESSTYQGEGNANDNNGQNFEQNENNRHFAQKNKKEILADLSNSQNYDLNFAKDFSSVLNKTLNYSLN